MTDPPPPEPTPPEPEPNPEPNPRPETEPVPAEAAAAPPAPEWADDEYLTSGRRFVRWNLITLIIGLAALGAGWAVLQARADQPEAGAPTPGE